MKLFVQFFALYLLGLSCLPCSDGEHQHAQTADGNPAQAFFSTDEHGCPEHRHCNDLCSPLCGCHCCSAVFVFQKPTIFQSPKKVEAAAARRIFPESTVALQDLAFAIDHPPQLS